MGNERTLRDERVTALREMIKQTFPADRYAGPVTPYDPGPWAEELDEEQVLYETLKGRSWTEAPADFLQQYPDAYLMLTAEAFVAFLAAWLNYSLENMGGENEVREYLVYACSPPGESWKVLSPLNPRQRASVRALMAEFVENEQSGLIREKAVKALTRIDELLTAGKYVPYTG